MPISLECPGCRRKLQSPENLAGRQVYSVGRDGKDDHAQVEWNLDPKTPQGDITFRLPE